MSCQWSRSPPNVPRVERRCAVSKQLIPTLQSLHHIGNVMRRVSGVMRRSHAAHPAGTRRRLSTRHWRPNPHAEIFLSFRVRLLFLLSSSLLQKLRLGGAPPPQPPPPPAADAAADDVSTALVCAGRNASWLASAICCPTEEGVTCSAMRTNRRPGSIGCC